VKSDFERLVQLPRVGHVLVEPALHQPACADLKKQVVRAPVERVEDTVIDALSFVHDHQEWPVRRFLVVTLSAFRLIGYPGAQPAASRGCNDMIVIAPGRAVTEQVSVS
jgi:hypothetical protein